MRPYFAILSDMIEYIILNIHHSDDYTDYLFQTAALTNPRVLPMVNPTPEELDAARKSEFSVVYNCYGRFRDPQMVAPSVFSHSINRTITALTHYYISEDGRINPTEAEIARALIEKELKEQLDAPQNLRDIYRRYFFGIWKNREQIYANPLYFYANCGVSNKFVKSVPLGVVLKAIEENPDLFTKRQSAYHRCPHDSILCDFQYYPDEVNEWHVHYCCPDCGEEVMEAYEWLRNRFHQKDQLAFTVEKTLRKYNRGQGRSRLNIFNVIDELSITR